MAHRSAFKNAERFYETYVKPLGQITIVEVGSQDVNGSIRQIFSDKVKYIGVDFAEANGVDVVLNDPYVFPFADGYAEAFVCSSVFEHSEFFWLTFTEMMRILKPGGLCFLNVPSNAAVHGYPVGCWRFYPDSGRALERWSIRQGYSVAMLESFMTPQDGGTFNDFVAVYVRGAEFSGHYPRRITDNLEQFENCYVLGSSEMKNPKHMPEDQCTIFTVRRYLNDRLQPV